MINEVTRTAAADTAPAKPTAITGEPRVDRALARLAGLDGLPGTGHVEAFEHVYERLHGLLDELDTPEPQRADRDPSNGQAQQA